MTHWRRLLFAVAALIPGTADAQEAAALTQEPERERSAFVYFAPDRLGLLIPIHERFLVRPDLGASSYRSDRYQFASFEAGLSLILRSAPSEYGWGYAALRYGLLHGNGTGFDDPWLSQSVSFALGGHAQIIDWLAVFGESGLSVRYAENEKSTTRGIDIEGGTSTRFGLALQRPLRDARVRAPGLGELPAGPERPSWLIGGFGDAGVLIPLSEQWMLRSDLGAHATAYRPYDSQSEATAGLSLLRRSRPAEQGWLYAALRYGLGYERNDADPISWIHVGSLTLGAHVRLTPRVSAFGEAGPFMRREEHRDVNGPFSRTSTGFIHSVGLSFRWKDREP